jgi:hypothetical protein
VGAVQAHHEEPDAESQLPQNIASWQISAEEIPQYTIKTTVISDKYSKAQLRK